MSESSAPPSAAPVPVPIPSEPPSHGGETKLLPLTLASLGVVFGDIGTSPLYAMRECLHHAHGISTGIDNIYGIVSLVFWALMIVISLKYVAYVLRADNAGEGGILALTALATSGNGLRLNAHKLALMVGLFGASLLFGDGIITPAISVLSAVEGLKVATPAFEPLILWIASVILVVLFSAQRRGTGSMGAVFGPVMLLWFLTLGVLGIYNIASHPGIFLAINPVHAVSFFIRNGTLGFLVLGSVFLVVTGGEALYADMGHFGAKPIRTAWFTVALPGLLLNYFGQGALLLKRPEALENPFYNMAPTWALYPLVVMATLATIIASQALISGAFSVTRQALMLGFLPRVRILHTSAHHIGQIYVPIVNWFLMLAAVGAVWGFGSSSGLAAAYGVAVTMDMTITTLLAYVVARTMWSWSTSAALAVTIPLLALELTFLGSNLTKLAHGGWFPLVVGALMFTIFTTWRRGRALLFEKVKERTVPLEDFYELMVVERPARVPGTAVYLTGNDTGTPPALLQGFLHMRAVHERVLLLTIITEKVARVAQTDRVRIDELENGFWRAVARYGFMETPNVPELLKHAKFSGYTLEYTTFFLGRETVLPTENPGMALWRERLFAFLTRNAQPATAFFGIPPSRVMEIGSQIEI
ncbi:MAG TPA: potassium transporter Kup [Polyangiaceae bacterium]|nr:potassium transporter Kup [Polyangiaceae bacterium]